MWGGGGPGWRARLRSCRVWCRRGCCRCAGDLGCVPMTRAYGAYGGDDPGGRGGYAAGGCALLFVAFPEEEQPGVDLLMVDSTNAEVPGLDVIADGLEGDQTGNLPVSKWAGSAKSLAATSPKHTGMPLLWLKGFGRGVWSSAKAAGLYIYATFDNEGVETRFPRCGKTLCRGPLPAESVLWPKTRLTL